MLNILSSVLNAAAMTKFERFPIINSWFNITNLNQIANSHSPNPNEADLPCGSTQKQCGSDASRKQKRFQPGVTSTSNLTPAVYNINRTAGIEPMRFGQALNEITIPEWKECYINYEILKIFVSVIKLLVELSNRCDQAMEMAREGWQPGLEVHLQPTANTQLQQLNSLKSEIEVFMVEMNQKFYHIFLIQTEIMELFYQMKTLEIEDRFRIIARLKNQEMEERKLGLYLTYIEYAYIEICYLAEMREANLEAERKILKKHKKYAKGMIPTPPPNHDKMQRMAEIQQHYTNKIEDLYVEQNKTVESKEAREFLRLTAQKEDPSERDYFFTGFGVGASLIVLVTLVFIIIYKGLSIQKETEFGRDFPTWRGIGIFIGYIWVLGFDLYIIEKYKISHRLIFKFNDHHYSTSTDLLKLAGIFTTIFLAVFFAYVIKISYVLDKDKTDLDKVNESDTGFATQYYVLIVYSCFFLYLLVPLPIFNHKGRIFALKLIGESLVSPIFGVTFSSAWIANQFLSLSTPLRDLAYTICYYTRLDFKLILAKNINEKGIIIQQLTLPPNPCRATETIEVALLLIIIPIIYRFLQCLRMGWDQGYWCTNNMFNSFKYLTSLGSALLAYFYRRYQKIYSWLLPSWIVVSAISTLYSYYWDIKKDWGLLQPNCRNYLLRKYITFEPKKTYYIVIVLNFIMRLSWTITLSPAITSLFRDPNLVTYVTGTIEIVRRGIWNLMRIQKEHINNCVEFKAIPDMTHIEEVIEDGRLTSEEVIGVRNKQHTKSREIVKKEFIQLLKKKLERRQIEEKEYNGDYEQKNMKKVKDIGKRLKDIVGKHKKEQ